MNRNALGSAAFSDTTRRRQGTHRPHDSEEGRYGNRSHDTVLSSNEKRSGSFFTILHICPLVDQRNGFSTTTGTSNTAWSNSEKRRSARGCAARVPFDEITSSVIGRLIAPMPFSFM